MRLTKFGVILLLNSFVNFMQKSAGIVEISTNVTGGGTFLCSPDTFDCRRSAVCDIRV